MELLGKVTEEVTELTLDQNLVEEAGEQAQKAGPQQLFMVEEKVGLEGFLL